MVPLGIITRQNPKLHFRGDYFKEQKQLESSVAGSALQSDAIYWKFYLVVAVCLGIIVLIHVQVKKPRYLEKNSVI